MNRKLVVVGVCCLVLLAGCNRRPSQAQMGQDKQAALQTYTQMKDAWARGDLNQADSLFRPDAIFIDPSGTLQYWDSAHKTLQQTFEQSRTTITDVGQPLVNVAGDAAWLASHYRAKVEAQGQVGEGEGVLTLTMVKSDGKYKIATFHSSRIIQFEPQQQPGPPTPPH